MKPPFPIEGTHLAVPIEGVSSIPVHPETGELVLPKGLSKAKLDEVKSYLSALNPDSLQAEPAKS